MAVTKGILVVMLWTTCQLGVSAQATLPNQLGSSCTIDEICSSHIPSSACINGVCACRAEFIPNIGNNKCLPVAKNIGDNCEETTQCTPFGTDAECIAQKCNCRPKYHFVNATRSCVASKGLDDKCALSTECYLPADGSSQHVECAGQQCKCTAGYEPTPDKRTCIATKDSAATKFISITCLVGAWILHLLM